MPDWYHVSKESAMVTEVRLLASRILTFRSILLHLALLAAFGIWLPRAKGIDFLDSQVLGAYSCLGLIFAAPATAQAFPLKKGTDTFFDAIGRIFAGVLYGEIVALTLVALGIATVYQTNRGGFVPAPDWETLAKCAWLGLGASAMLASLAALLAVRFSNTVAMICLRLVFFGLLILFFYRGRWLPDVGLTGAGVCFVITGIEIALLRKAAK